MGFVVFGLIGVIIGVVFGFVVMFVEFIGGYFGYDVVVVEVYRNRLRELWNLRDVCRVWIDQKMEFLDKVELLYIDVYVNNQVVFM